MSHSDIEDDNSLEDSTYDLLSDSVISHSDDDDRSSIASLDSPTDELTNFDDDDEVEQDEASVVGENTPESISPKISGIPSFGGLDENLLDDSTLTVIRDQDEPNDSIIVSELDEEGTSCLEVLPREIAEQMTSKYRIIPRPDKLYVHLSMKMSKEPLAVSKTFRFLYIGDPSAKDEIIKKAGTALMINSKQETETSSRFNIVPISSFGDDKAYPEVELIETFGLEVAVDVCTSLSVVNKVKSHHDDPTFDLHLESGTTVRSYADGRGIENWTVPQLVVIYSMESDNEQMKETIENAHKFVQRHGLGSIELVDTSLTNEHKMSLKCSSQVVLTAEPMLKALDSMDVYHQSPIDFHTFMRLDPHQLNRNINYILQNCSDTKVMYTAQESLKDRVCELAKRIWAYIQTSQIINTKEEPQAPESVFSVILFILAALGAMLFTFNLIREGTSSNSFDFRRLSPFPPIITTTSISTTTHSVKSISTVTQVVTSTVSTTVPVIATERKSSSLTVKPTPKFTSSAALSKSKYAPLTIDLNESEDFKFYTIGGSHVIIKPPQRYSLLKKPPQLMVKVSRKDQKIKGKLSKLFQGVYSLAIDERHAHGLMNVTVYTKSKPFINTTQEINFGSTWSRIFAPKQFVIVPEPPKKLRSTSKAQIKKMARDATNKVKQNFQENFDKSSMKAQQKIKTLKKSAKKIRSSTRRQTLHAQKCANDRLKQGVQAAARMSRDAKLLYSFASKHARRGLEQRIHKAQREAVSRWAELRKTKKKLL